MKVSILVPVYGVEKYIERCARSLFGQTYEDLEFVFVDDCSPDRSIAILRQVMERYPKRRSQIKIIHHQVNKGVAAARKTAITHASGDFLMFVDADDYISLEATSLLVNIQKTSAADIVSGDVLAFNAKTKKEISTPRIKSPHDLLLLLLRWKAIPSLCARLIKRSLFNTDIINSENINISEDYLMLSKLLYNSNKVDYLNKIIYYYDCSNEGSAMHTLNAEKEKQHMQSMLDVARFFKDKASDCYEVQCHSIARMILGHKICYRRSKAMYSYLDYIHSVQKTIDNSYWNDQPILYRWGLHITNWRLLDIYYTFLSLLSRILSRLGSTALVPNIGILW